MKFFFEGQQRGPYASGAYYVSVEKPYLLFPKGRNVVFKDLSETDYHKHQFAFKVSDYRKAADAKKHALLSARLYRLLADKTYFHPKTVFGVYSTGEGKNRVYRIFSIMPKLKPLKRVSFLGPEVKKTTGILLNFLKQHGLSTELTDFAVGEPWIPENFMQDKNGKVYAVDTGLWHDAKDVPTSKKLLEIPEIKKFWAGLTRKARKISKEKKYA